MLGFLSLTWLFFVLCSSAAHIWDAFLLASASYRLYCLRRLNVSSYDDNVKVHLLGNPPKIEVFTPELEAEEDREGSLNTLSTIKIHDDEVNLRFLVCGVPCISVSFNDSSCCHNYFDYYSYWMKLRALQSLSVAKVKVTPLQDEQSLSSLEDGLNALLTTEVSIKNKLSAVISFMFMHPSWQ